MRDAWDEGCRPNLAVSLLLCHMRELGWDYRRTLRQPPLLTAILVRRLDALATLLGQGDTL